MNEPFFYFLHIMMVGFAVMGFLRLPYIFKGICWVIALMLALTIFQEYSATTMQKRTHSEQGVL